MNKEGFPPWTGLIFIGLNISQVLDVIIAGQDCMVPSLTCLWWTVPAHFAANISLLQKCQEDGYDYNRDDDKDADDGSNYSWAGLHGTASLSCVVQCVCSKYWSRGFFMSAMMIEMMMTMIIIVMMIRMVMMGAVLIIARQDCMVPTPYLAAGAGARSRVACCA